MADEFESFTASLHVVTPWTYSTFAPAPRYKVCFSSADTEIATTVIITMHKSIIAAIFMYFFILTSFSKKGMRQSPTP